MCDPEEPAHAPYGVDEAGLRNLPALNPRAVVRMLAWAQLPKIGEEPQCLPFAFDRLTDKVDPQAICG